jgi:hypothetical protein
VRLEAAPFIARLDTAMGAPAGAGDHVGALVTTASVISS